MEKILVIDDDSQLTALLDEFFSSFNYQVIIHNNPLKGISYLENNTVDRTNYYQPKIIKIQLGSGDDSGRRKAEPINGSEENLDTDLIIEALGFEPENLPIMFNISELSLTQWGTLKINYKTMMTNIEGDFAAGDIVRGASLVVWGIKDGRDVAENIHNFLLSKEKLQSYVVSEDEKEFAHA